MEKTPLGLAGSHQRWNAALALAMIGAAGFSPSAEAVAKGLRDVSWPGRFQQLPLRGGELILDGAHNLHAAKQLVSTWREVHGERRCRLIFGALSDKDPSALLNELLPLATSVVLVPVPSPRSAKPADLAAVIAAASPSVDGCKPVVHIADSLREALVDNSDALPAHVGTQECPVLLVGSLFLVGEALALISGGEATLRSQ
jgi:dihydrofolate synthase/folylpolyglutamate synthase